MPCNTKALRDQTVEYWNSLARANENAEALNQILLKEYINGLLRAEIDCAKERAQQKEGIWPKPEQKADVLVLLVGFTPEPLLQSICAYQPAEIVLILNQKYYSPGDSLRFARDRVLLLLDELKALTPTLLDKPFEKVRLKFSVPPRSDKPGDIFQILLEELREDVKHDKNIVVDITGGKKSMVAGAYFFAAYTGAKISYVDFEEYREGHRRPYGYSCQIGFLPNPYEIFGLRFWELVRDLYERSIYDEASKLLAQIIQSMKAEYFTSGQIDAVKLMIALMAFYDAWSNGDYHGAKKLSDGISKKSQKFLPLNAVELLYNHWPERLDLAELPAKPEAWKFYSDSAMVAKYAQDECEKVARLVEKKNDYRAGLLRAAGLNEVLHKARLALFFNDGQLELFRGSNKLNDDAAKEQIAEKLKAYFIEKILMGKNNEIIEEDYGSPNNRMKAQKGNEAFMFMSRFPDSKSKVKSVRDLRNKVTHFVLPVSKEIAAAALQVAKDNVQDFKEVWLKAKSTEPKTGLDAPPAWRDLCEWCEIRFLPLS